ncbi:hypothetical protein ACWCWQ_02300 [Streptomyces sp. NPDC001571]
MSDTVEAAETVDGLVAVRDLREALAGIGVTLPSLRLDGEVLGRDHVQLGGCTAQQVKILADWIKAHNS